ncbi:MAG: molybdate ABC transporter permease subunit, partial [Gemmatimonadales bacterium]
LALPSIVAGAIMSWARALGEFGATITFAGNLAGRTETMPLAVYTAMQTDLDAAVALAVLLVVFAFALLLGLRAAPWAVSIGGGRARREGR